MVSREFRERVEDLIATSGTEARIVFNSANGYEAAFLPDIDKVLVSYNGGPIQWQDSKKIAAAMGTDPDGNHVEPYGAYLRRVLLAGLIIVPLFWAFSAWLNSIT